VLRNAGEVSSRGVELDLISQPWEGAQFNLGVAYVDAKFDDFKGAPCTVPQRLASTCSDGAGGQDLTGKAINQAPRWQYTLSGQQTFRLAGVEAYVRGEYAWRDDVIADGDLDPHTRLNAYGVANFRLGVQSSDRWDATLFVRNAFDEKYNYRIGDAPLFTGAYGGYPAPGRSYGVEFKLSY